MDSFRINIFPKIRTLRHFKLEHSSIPVYAREIRTELKGFYVVHIQS